MKKASLCLMIVTILFLAGCQSDTLPDTYIKGSDYQYKQCSGTAYSQVQQGDGFVYLYHNCFIYYLEEGIDVITPLCNRADCLHDKEQDAEKRKACNAYVDFFEYESMAHDAVTIAKCGGYIYCMNPAAFLGTQQTLCRYALDGTSKEAVYTWNSEESAVLEWIIHRDVLYYTEKRYFQKDNEVIVENMVKSLALTGSNRKPQTIYQADENLNVLSLCDLRAYGNYLYFLIISQWKGDGDTIREEERYDILYDKTFVYDIQKDEIKELQIPGLPVSAQILGVQFWQDKLIIDPYDQEKQGNALMPVYIAELDGSNPTVLLQNVAQAGYFLSDGEYLYAFDDWMPNMDDWLSNPGVYTVYDKEFNVVDTFRAPFMPDGKVERLPVGETDNMYFIYEDEEDGTWGVVRWDKENIGSYQGEPFSLTEIVYR